MTCDTINEHELCFFTDDNSTMIKPCVENSSNACVDNNGLVNECLLLFDQDNIDSNNRLDIIEFNWMLERKFERIEPLCTLPDQNKLTVCSKKESHHFACLFSTNGKIGPCNETEPYLMPIQVCIEVSLQSKPIC